MNRSSAVKVGALTLVSIALLIFVLIWLRGRGIQPGETYTVRFQDVDGMREGAPVQMMGIRVGFVDAIRPLQVNKKYYVEVGFNISDPNLIIPDGSKLSIEQSGIIGEKFLEITPPQLKEITLTTFRELPKPLHAGMPVKFLYEKGLLTVGHVEKVDVTQDDTLSRHRLYYRITMPGAVLPKYPVYELALDADDNYYLRILHREPVAMAAPDRDLIFTVENPLRIKDFLQIQMDSAESLKTTNEKVNQLLSDETIETMHRTLRNTEVLTARATDVLDSANELFATTRSDLTQLVKTSDELAVSLIAVSENLNQLLGNRQLQDDIFSAVHSIQDSANTLNTLIQDPKIEETLAMTHDTMANTAELTETLNKLAHDQEVQERLNNSLNQMNASLDKLSVILTELENATTEDDSLKSIIEDTRETTENMKQFSKKLNGRFLLFRLMF